MFPPQGPFALAIPPMLGMLFLHTPPNNHIYRCLASFMSLLKDTFSVRFSPSHLI